MLKKRNFIIFYILFTGISLAGLTTLEIKELRKEIITIKHFLENEKIEETYTTHLKDEVINNFNNYVNNINHDKYRNNHAYEISRLMSKWGDIIRDRFGNDIVDSLYIDIEDEMCYWYNTRENQSMNHWGYEDRLINSTHVAVGNEKFGKATITGTFYIGKKVAHPVSRWEKRKVIIPYGHLFNSFGARKLELWKDGRYTVYSCHGTNDTTSVGKHISLGCVRFNNKDVLILFELVREDETVVVIEN